MNHPRKIRWIGSAVASAFLLPSLIACSTQEPPEDPRGYKWGDASELPQISSLCRTLNNGELDLPAIYKPEHMTFTSSVYRKGITKRTTQWTVDVSIPRIDLPAKEATCVVSIYGEDLVQSVEILEK